MTKPKVLRFKGVKLKHLVGACGIELHADFPGVEVGAVMMLPPNGRFIIQAKQTTPDHHVHLTLTRDPTSRKQRRSA